MTNPTGEAENNVLRLDFDHRIMVQFRGSVVTSDAGLLAYRELDDALGLTTAAGDLLADARTGKNGRHTLVGMFRQSVFGRLAGYEDVNDALRLRHDPAIRWIIGGKGAKGLGASPSRMGRFETNWLAKPQNLATLTDLSGHWIDRVAKRRPRGRVVLDMDSSVSPTYGDQEGSVWNGHYVTTCYHPIFVFNEYGDLERCALRPGNVHSADAWETVLKPVIARYQVAATSIAFRGDAAFAQPSMYEYLESGHRVRDPPSRQSDTPGGDRSHAQAAGRAADALLAALLQELSLSVGRVDAASSPKWNGIFGEIFPRIGFIVTNSRCKSTNVVAFYNKRGLDEQYVKEWKGALKGTRLSFDANAVRLQLHALAYNLDNFLRTLAVPETIAEWSLTTLREKLIKIGAKVASHGRYVAFQMAEVAIPRRLFATIERITALIAALGGDNMNAQLTPVWEKRREICPLLILRLGFSAPDGPMRASFRDERATRLVQRAGKRLNRPATARKGDSYGECRIR
ncbi:MAG TPA: IS1380 family transposase [Candidatus Baltobacteraceae bacterium]|nr:IS1380 family transposase [Candidatus Baltobacteraceae bacterium]